MPNHPILTKAMLYERRERKERELWDERVSKYYDRIQTEYLNYRQDVCLFDGEMDLKDWIRMAQELNTLFPDFQFEPYTGTTQGLKVSWTNP